MSESMTFVEHVLRVSAPEPCAEFYERGLGFRRLGVAPDGSPRLGLDPASVVDGPREVELVLRSPSSQAGEGLATDERYWKIGLTVPDLAGMAKRLGEQGIEVSTPAWFQDVGYLAHTVDPAGYVIELLQREAGPPARPVLAHVTLRVSDAEESLAFYRDLGLHPWGRVPVPSHRFDLWFLASGAAPHDVDRPWPEGREWLWSRPFTCLELQHRWDGPPVGGEGPGVHELVFSDPGMASGTSRRLRDPDGNAVVVRGPSVPSGGA